MIFLVSDPLAIGLANLIELVGVQDNILHSSQGMKLPSLK
jgi:hypothetical protein